jgi:hypothetical protein
MSTLHRTSTPEQQPIEKHRQERGHDFYPSADQLAQIRRIYGTDPVPTRDKSLWLHYFTGACDWWIAEYDPATGDAFGYACLGDPDNAEWGYTNLADLEALYSPSGITRGQHTDTVRLQPRVLVERDLTWIPRPVTDAQLPGRATRA